MSTARKSTAKKTAAPRKHAAAKPPAEDQAPDYTREGSGTSRATANDTTPPPAPTTTVTPERQDAPSAPAAVSVDLGNVVTYVMETVNGTVTGQGVILSDGEDSYVIAKLELVTVPSASVITEPVG